jgi:hypothetical protein
MGLANRFYLIRPKTEKDPRIMAGAWVILFQSETSMNGQTQIIRTRTGPCGSGKTRATLEEIVSRPGYYIWAAQRAELIVETADKLKAMADKAGKTIDIEIIISDRHAQLGTKPNCRNAIEALPRIFETPRHPHVVAFVTSHS